MDVVEVEVFLRVVELSCLGVSCSRVQSQAGYSLGAKKCRCEDTTRYIRLQALLDKEFAMLSVSRPRRRISRPASTSRTWTR